jgi:hypothetical protein
MIITVPQLAADALGSILASDMQRAFGSSFARLTEINPVAARLALDCIGTSDALYHNVEHTMLVTLVARDIAYGRMLLVPTTPEDHGVLKADTASGYVIDDSGRKISLPRGASDAALQPYHVDRSKLFVLDRVAAIEELDAARIAGAIEATRFSPSAALDEEHIDEEGSLVRAADLMGQLGDPHYLQKANALYYEFEEIGINRQRGYNSPVQICTAMYFAPNGKSSCGGCPIKPVGSRAAQREISRFPLRPMCRLASPLSSCQRKVIWGGVHDDHLLGARSNAIAYQATFVISMKFRDAHEYGLGIDGTASRLDSEDRIDWRRALRGEGSAQPQATLC